MIKVGGCDRVLSRAGWARRGMRGLLVEVGDEELEQRIRHGGDPTRRQ